MALTEQQIEDLQAISRSGRAVEVCEYIKVDWDAHDSGETRYYATSQYNKIPPFGSIGFNIEPRIIGEPFKTLELFPDLRTDTIPIVFNDLDKTITSKFQGFGSGVRIEFFLYYPQVNGHHSVWFGQLQAPQVYGRKKIETIATNGFRSREQLIPKSLRPKECRHRAYNGFGGQLTAEALLTSGCKYDKHLGGSTGNFRTGTTPYVSCPGDETACAARGMTAYFGGYDTDVASVITDHRSGYLAVSKGNPTNRDPIRVIFGTKTVRGNRLLFWRREMNAKDQDKGFVAGVWEVGEGPVRNIRNIKVGEKLIEQMHLAPRLGYPAQGALTQYAPDISNFSNVAHYFARKGWVDPLTENAQTMVSECVVEGFTQVTHLNATDTGNGLKCEIGTGTTVGTNKIAERIDATVNFPQRNILPIDGLNSANGYWLKWTGTITFEFSETYTMSLYHDDIGVLIINGSTVISNSSFGTHTGNFVATAGTPYTFELRITNNANAGVNPWGAVLQWSSSSQSLEVVPSSALLHAGAAGYIKQWTNNRVWCLLELMHNQRFGMSYPLARFNHESWINAASWAGQSVVFSYTNADGETRNFSHTRTLLDVVCEGRPVAEQIVDICRAGRFSVPYQKDGEFHVQPFRAFTTAELAAAKVFTDTGSTQNILWSQGRDREPLINISGIVPDDKLVNEITLVFEDGSFDDQERPVTIDNPNQKLKAGRTLGEDNLQAVPIRYAAFGCRNLNEVIKLGYGTLRFGEFDEGGIFNNLPVILEVPLVEALGVERYGVIKIVSEVIDGFLLPADDDFETFEQAEYFRVLKIVKTSKDTAQITAQVYNHTAYSAFETNSSDWPPALPPPNSDPDGTPGTTEPPKRVNLTAIDYSAANSVITFITSV